MTHSLIKPVHTLLAFFGFKKCLFDMSPIDFVLLKQTFLFFCLSGFLLQAEVFASLHCFLPMLDICFNLKLCFPEFFLYLKKMIVIDKTVSY